MTWTVEVVKARFFEAADVERRMIVKGMSGGGNAWPSYSYDKEDMAGWDDAAIADNLERWQGRKVTKSPEITRWEEVFFEWTQLIPEPRRLLVWRWAQCIALGRSFSKYCEDKGIVRATAYNRLERVFENLTIEFRNASRLLLWPDEKWSGQFDGNDASKEHKMDEVAPKRGPTIHPPFRSEKHHDNLTTPEALGEFTKHLAAHNRAQTRKREKALRGVPGEQEAA